MERKDWLGESVQKQNKALLSPTAMSAKLLSTALKILPQNQSNYLHHNHNFAKIKDQDILFTIC